ncbi:hypothetical protein AA0472_2682 [Acetobacter estunensis NRIC 0472]|uniref:hypothetical protein n=1 Tax=Acetobacter estunensis TaxID=104097 RepID=UPI00140AB503|nr:hypothetical protein [Acetobacter estunensis]GBQ28375.1 hypothetical protein AA0472_2682 [Acetobacter estunensis NRIC 0472]
MNITPLPSGDIEGTIRFIQEIPFEKLQDAAYIEHVMLPTLGFNNEILEEFPVSLLPWCGHGNTLSNSRNTLCPYQRKT